MRQIVLDTETTGLEPEQGHRIIEIGCVELLNRRKTGNHFHQYLQPDREIDAGAVEVHGITNAFLADKPRFGDVVDEFLQFIDGAELIIHNAPFDVGFINHELALVQHGWGGLSGHCQVTDTLQLARQLHPGQRNSLDALCKRYSIDNSHRQWHGALLDAEILADVYLTMTGGQAAFALSSGESAVNVNLPVTLTLSLDRPQLRVLRAADAEVAEHDAYLDKLAKAAGGNCIWRLLDAQINAD